MFSEPRIRHKLQGEMPPVPSESEKELKPKYWEVLLEDSPTLTMYLWMHMTVLQHLPGRVPADESGYHFPNLWRQCALELVQKRPMESVNKIMSHTSYHEWNLSSSPVFFQTQVVSLPKYGLLSTWIPLPKCRLLSIGIPLPKDRLLSTWIPLPKYRLFWFHYQNIGYSQLGSHSQLARKKLKKK